MTIELDIPEISKEKLCGVGFAKRVVTTTTFGIPRNKTIESTSISLISEYAEEFFTESGHNVPTWIISLMQKHTKFGIDLDSMENGVLRFYTGGSRVGQSAYTPDYPFTTDMPDLDQYRFLGMGFFVDMSSYNVTEYKHYFQKIIDKNVLLNYHFEPDGTYKYLGEEIGYDGKDDFVEETKYLRQSGEYKWSYMKRTDKDQRQLVANKMWRPFVMFNEEVK